MSKKIDDSKPQQNSTDSTIQLTEQLAELLISSQNTICTAESCTGGLLSAELTSVAGSSSFFSTGFVTYSNLSKRKLLQVNSATLLCHGAVSEAVVGEMFRGALTNSQSSLGVAITGIAGPGGGSLEKPVGTVCFAWGSNEQTYISTQNFAGDRSQVRSAAVEFSLRNLIQFLQQKSAN